MKTIKLTRGLEALVDDDDFEKFGSVKWMAASWREYTYAYRTSNHKTILLHRQIMGEPENLIVDHKNHNTLDCRKSNLRTCTHSENSYNRKGPNSNNTSGQRGVSRHKGKWRVRVTVGGKTIYVGRFKDKEQAIAEYRIANKKYYGDFSSP